MQVVEIELSKIKPYEKNAKKHTRDQIRNVAESIKQFGFRQPLVVDKNYVIIIGHCRFAAAKKLKLEKVPCEIVEDLTEEQVNSLRLIDNKTNESEWDLDLLLEELKTVNVDDFKIDWGILEKEPLKEIIEDDFDIDKALPEEPKAKIGDIYQLGRHRLMCGDSTKKEDVEKLMDGIEADLLLTDPPYNVDYEGSDGKKLENDNMLKEEYKEFLIKAFKNADEFLKPGASFYIWHASREVETVIESLKETDLTVKQQLIWRKNALVMGRQDYQWIHEPCLYGWKEGAAHNWYNDRKQTTIMDFDRPVKNDLHPTQKPIKLFNYLIENSSKKNTENKETIVLDLFGGSGTTLICCEQNDRTCYMMEYDPKYVDVIIARYESFTGKKATKID